MWWSLPSLYIVSYDLGAIRLNSLQGSPCHSPHLFPIGNTLFQPDPYVSPTGGFSIIRTIWDFNLSTLPGILNTQELSPIQRIVQPIVIHRHCLLHCHTSVYNSVNSERGRIEVKKGRASVKESGLVVRKRAVNRREPDLASEG